ncbi:hypothetical protein Bbelb_292350 [Branchiostoma belcheri]|nr:hypothetical protein Bbelb_292350 [Branchiostoma belcheri]
MLHRNGCNIANVGTGECACLDFVWRGPGMDRCKHVQAAGLFHTGADREVEKAQENDIQPITPVPERELPEVARPAPLHRKRPWRRLTTADSHQPRVPSRARKTKGAKPRRPARLAPTNRGGIDAPETDEIACVCGVN